MAESQKGGSSPVNSKEKTSLLDVDFGKDFLTSWKSMSVAEDDAMDFDFGTVSKGKKKAFNFDKLDVNFSLDGDLDKISSFKVDISDLDISSPPKKAGKPKERSKEESAGGNHQLKQQDRFTFPFDFNELDSFNFESSLMKEGKKFNKNRSSEEASNTSECQASGIDLTDGIVASEAGTKPKFAASGGLTTAKIETRLGVIGEIGSMNKNFPSNSALIDHGPSKSESIQNPFISEEARIFPDKTSNTSSQEIDRDSHHQQVKTISPEPYSPETMQDLSIQSVSENESTRNTVSELQMEVSSLATKVTSNVGEEQNVNFKSVAGLGLDCANSLLEKSSPPQHIAMSLNDIGERNRVGSDDNGLVENIDGTEPAQSISENISYKCVSRESILNTNADTDSQKGNTELHLAPLSSRIPVSQMKEKETCVIQSKYFKRSDEKESQSQQKPSTQTKFAISGGKTIGSRVSTEAIDVESGSKLVKISPSHSGEQNKGEFGQPGSTRSLKGLKYVGEHFIADGALNGTKLLGSSRLSDQEVTKGEPIQGRETNIKNFVTLSSRFTPSSSSQQTNKFSIQKSATPRLTASGTASIKNSNKICGEGNTNSPLKADRCLPDLSSLKISRTLGVNHHLSNSTCQIQNKSLRNTKQNMELQGGASSKIAHAAYIEKQTPPTPSLKRKTLEVSNADMLNLNPSKRLSQSPTESRNVRELSERVVDKEVFHHENLTDSNTSNVLKDCHTILDIPPEVNMTELQIPLVMENDDSVEKAEAYTKELEDICNMLKKKHEAAKEILVRAIINNNNLLMLNHPIYEEKICKVQKFADQLMSKELHT